jgi:hypothetical protein
MRWVPPVFVLGMLCLLPWGSYGSTNVSYGYGVRNAFPHIRIQATTCPGTQLSTFRLE